MKTIFYDILPDSDGCWLLRCSANGRIVQRSGLDESRQTFIKRCNRYVYDRSTPERPARLRVYEEER